jgi:putative endonuclease
MDSPSSARKEWSASSGDAPRPASPAAATPPGVSRSPSPAPRRPLHLRVGAHGEAAACERLEANGYQILARNYRCPSGEIDIVAADGPVLVFVEVKTRSSAAFGSPRDAVTAAKRRKLARSASHYMLAHREQECAYRADIIEVALLRGAVAAVRHLQGAFSIEAELEKLSG